MSDEFEAGVFLGVVLAGVFAALFLFAYGATDINDYRMNSTGTSFCEHYNMTYAGWHYRMNGSYVTPVFEFKCREKFIPVPEVPVNRIDGIGVEVE